MSTPLNFYSYNGILDHISPHTNTGFSILLMYVQSRTVPNWGTLLSCTSDITTVSFILGSNSNYLDIKAIFQKYLKRALTCLRTATTWEQLELPAVKPKVKYWTYEEKTIDIPYLVKGEINSLSLNLVPLVKNFWMHQSCGSKFQ